MIEFALSNGVKMPSVGLGTFLMQPDKAEQAGEADGGSGQQGRERQQEEAHAPHAHAQTGGDLVAQLQHVQRAGEQQRQRKRRQDVDGRAPDARGRRAGKTADHESAHAQRGLGEECGERIDAGGQDAGERYAGEHDRHA